MEDQNNIFSKDLKFYDLILKKQQLFMDVLDGYGNLLFPLSYSMN